MAASVREDTERASRTARSRPLLWTSFGLLMLFVLLGIGVAVSPASPWTQGLDDAWRGLVGVGPESSLPASPLARLFQEIGALPGFAVMMILLPLIPVSAVWARRIWLVVGALLAIGIVWQRTLINAHWFSDTVAGLIGGAAIALLLWWAFQPWLVRDHTRRVWFLRRS